MTKQLDLSKFQWPIVTELDMAFPIFDTIPELLEEAKKRNPKKGMKKFSEIFYSGGSYIFQKDVKDTWKEKAFIYAQALMKSWAPKHVHKELVVGMIFEECLKL